MAFQTTYLKIIAGEKPGWTGGLARAALTVLSWTYSIPVRVRNHLYTTGWLKAHKAGVPVICVGNLTTGGTGKTPLVVWLCRHLQERQIRRVILTRGYKSDRLEAGGRRPEAPTTNSRPPTASLLNDEPALLSAQCPGTAVLVNPDRVAGAAEAVRRHDAQVLVMDDGFQHRRLARDLDIVAIDATRPFGFDKVLPAGLLREPVTGLRRAHAVVLTRCDQAAEDALQRIEARVLQVNPSLVVARSVHMPVAIQTVEGTQIGLDHVRGQRLFAFCGIGNPRSFLHTIERLGGVLVGSRVYDDHHPYTAGDLEQIHQEAAAGRADLILTTQKDWTKVARRIGPPTHPPLGYLAIELQITAGAQKLTALIDRLIGGIMPAR